MRAPMRSATPGCARRKSARSPRRRRVRATARGVEHTEREAAEARKREEEERRDTRRRPSARPSRRPRSGSAKRKPRRPATAWRAVRCWSLKRTKAPRASAAAPAARGPAAAPSAPNRRAQDPTEQPADGSRSSPPSSDDEERERSVAAFRRRIQRRKREITNEPKEKLVREVTIPEAITIQELANRMAERARRRHQAADEAGPDGEDHRRDRCRYRPADRRGNGPYGQARRRIRRRGRPVRRRRRSGDAACRARRSSPSWAMSITARRRCSTRSARPMWSPARPAASRSISAPIR